MSKFKEMGLMPEIVNAVESMGFETPTPIQEKTIPAILSSDRDVLALAQTGTGKTAAFGLPIINQIDYDNKNVQALILCPTRELCMQISADFEKFSANLKQLKTLAVYGGASITNQIKDLKKGVQIVVGTPGRTLDLIKRKSLKINKITWLVLDEADEMLNMGFQEDLDEILSTSPGEKQVYLFSATMPKSVQNITGKYMTDPIELTVGKRNAGAENVRHHYYMVNARNRYDALKRIADMFPKIYAIIFCRTRMETKEVADKLIADGYNADALHGDLSQAQRDYVMNRFRMKSLQMLVATDVAARGLDVNDLTHVINYNLPDDLEAYVHRSGRTGRAGKSGISISIIHGREKRKIRDLQKITGKDFARQMVPNGRQICEKQLFNLVDRVENIEVNEEEISDFLPVVYKKLEWLDREQLIKHFVSVEFNRFLNYYKDAQDLNIQEAKDGEGKRKKRKKSDNKDTVRRSSGEFSRFFINIGTKDKLNVATLLGFINRKMKNFTFEIGKIDLMKSFSFFEIEKSLEKEALSLLNNTDFDGKNVIVELSKPAPEKTERKSRKEEERKKSNRRKGSSESKRKKSKRRR